MALHRFAPTLSMSSTVVLDEFFTGFDGSRHLFDLLWREIEAIGPVEMRVTRSQVAFRRRRAFAWAWVPDRYLRGDHAPLVLSVRLERRDGSRRWKQIVEPANGQFMHHLEFWTAAEVNDEVRHWLAEAWASAL